MTVWLVAARSDDELQRAGRPGTDFPSRSPEAAGPPRREPGSRRGRHAPQADRDRARYKLLPRAEPAKIVPDPDPVVPADVLNPIVNGWRAGDRRGIILVEAGLAGDDPSGTTGRFVIFRERERPFAQDVHLVDVPGSGELRITGAPTGLRAARSAQRRGKIEFTSERGVTGTLDLQHDRVTLGSR
jgi:hypothetical protein